MENSSQNGMRFTGVSDAINLQAREIQREDSNVHIKVIPESNPLNNNPINEYSSDYTNMSTDNNFKYNVKGSLPTLSESVGKKLLNKSVPRLSHPGYPIVTKHPKVKKRRLNINKLASNLHKKD